MTTTGVIRALALAAAMFVGGSGSDGSPIPEPPSPSGTAAARGAADAMFQTAGRPERQKSKKSRPRRISLAKTFSMHFIYDDNILRMSDETVLDFRANNPPEKFIVETYDDLILSPRLGVTIGRPMIGRKEMTLRLGYIGWFYARNGEKTNMTYSARLRQPTIGSDYLELSGSYAPTSYIRELSDRPPFVPRSTPLVYDSFKSTRNAAGLAYYHRFGPRLSARAELGRVIRYYNKPFMENDNWEWNGEGTVSIRLARSIRLATRYMYSDVESRNADTEGETDENTDDGNLDYERDLYEAILTIRPRGWLWIGNSIELLGQYQAYHYTSQQHPLDDPYHVGRKDEITSFETTIGTRAVWRKVTLEVGYRFSERDSSLPGRIGEDVGEEKDYTDHRLWIGMSTPF